MEELTVKIQQPKISWSYLGGIMEGESCIHLNPRSNNEYGLASYHLSISQKKVPLLRLIKRVLNCGNIRINFIKGAPRTPEFIRFWQWQVSNRKDIQWIIVNTVNYLIGKKKEAIDLLKYFELLDKRDEALKGVSSRSPEYKRIALTFKDELKRLTTAVINNKVEVDQKIEADDQIPNYEQENDEEEPVNIRVKRTQSEGKMNYETIPVRAHNIGKFGAQHIHPENYSAESERNKVKRIHAMRRTSSAPEAVTPSRPQQAVSSNNPNNEARPFYRTRSSTKSHERKRSSTKSHERTRSSRNLFPDDQN
jgi:hypothetical protein